MRFTFNPRPLVVKPGMRVSEGPAVRLMTNLSRRLVIAFPPPTGSPEPVRSPPDVRATDAEAETAGAGPLHPCEWPKS